MIRINLLPDNQRRSRRSKRHASSSDGVSPLVILLLLTMFGGLSYVGYEMVWRPYNGRQLRLTSLTSTRESLASKVQTKKDEIKDLGEIEKMVREQLEVLQILDPDDRLLWSEKLNILSDLRPANVYISRLKLDENERKVETQASIKARGDWEKSKNKTGKKPPKIERSIITQTLTIYGISYAHSQNTTIAEEQAIANFMAYHKALKEHKKVLHNPANNYMHDFLHGMEKDIEIGPWKKDVIAGRSVFNFEFKIKSKPLLNEEEKQSTKAGTTTAGKDNEQKEKPA